ncbi:hypothetical protein OH492_24985 [Vibrio chagasii]|nr:hypothetical protein [Vibrio chagasii]
MKGLFCNADFFHASAYHFMDIPTKLFTPIFVMSRLTGWTAYIRAKNNASFVQVQTTPGQSIKTGYLFIYVNPSVSRRLIYQVVP